MKACNILQNVAGVITDCVSFNESKDLNFRSDLYDLIEKRLEFLEKLGFDCNVYYRRDKDDSMTYTRIVSIFDGIKVTVEI